MTLTRVAALTKSATVPPSPAAPTTLCRNWCVSSQITIVLSSDPTSRVKLALEVREKTVFIRRSRRRVCRRVRALPGCIVSPEFKRARRRSAQEKVFQKTSETPPVQKGAKNSPRVGGFGQPQAHGQAG